MTRPTAGKDAETQDCSNIASGNIKLYSQLAIVFNFL